MKIKKNGKQSVLTDANTHIILISFYTIRSKCCSFIAVFTTKHSQTAYNNNQSIFNDLFFLIKTFFTKKNNYIVPTILAVWLTFLKKIIFFLFFYLTIIFFLL